MSEDIYILGLSERYFKTIFCQTVYCTTYWKHCDTWSKFRHMRTSLQKNYKCFQFFWVVFDICLIWDGSFSRGLFFSLNYMLKFISHYEADISIQESHIFVNELVQTQLDLPQAGLQLSTGMRCEGQRSKNGNEVSNSNESRHKSSLYVKCVWMCACFRAQGSHGRIDVGTKMDISDVSNTK